MPVTDFGILADGTDGPHIGQDGTTTYKVRLFARTDVEMSGGAVLASPGMPIKFGQHADDQDAFCIGVSSKQDEDDATYWILDYDYSTNIKELAQAAFSNSGGLTGGGEEDPQHNDADPLDRRPVVKIRSKRLKKLRFADLDGRAIQNLAGVPYEAYTDEVSRTVIDVTRNVAGFDMDMVPLCEDGVNEIAWLGKAKRQIWCASLSADFEREKRLTYVKLHAELVIAKESDILNDNPANGGLADGYWAEWKLNAGYEELDLVTGLLKDIKIRGQRPARPVLLNLFGERLAVSQLGNPIFLGFRVKDDAPLHQLGLFD